MRQYRSYALGAALLSLAIVVGACGSGGGGTGASPSGGTNTIASTFVFGAPPDRYGVERSGSRRREHHPAAGASLSSV